MKYFFLLESVRSDYLSHRERWNVFKKLADVFCIEIDYIVKGYFNESEKKHFQDIKDVSSYERLCRIIEFAEKSGQEAEMTEQDYLILSQIVRIINPLRTGKISKNETLEII